MTLFDDKPKRKRTPNRRRKFLLMIGLPILALIAGYVALKPQMDAWLATDPFTPPCHFETDRLFATGFNPTQFSSINDGLNLDYSDYGMISGLSDKPIKWSPNGEYVLYELGHQTVIADFKQNIYFIVANGTTSLNNWNWSPDGRYGAYSVVLTTFDATTESTIRDHRMYVYDTHIHNLVEDLSLSDIFVFFWSPDSRYLVAYDFDDNLRLIDVYAKQITDVPYMEPFPTWASDSSGLYYVQEAELYFYDLELGEQQFLAYLPDDTSSVSIINLSHNDEIIRIWDTLSSTSLYSQHTSEVTLLDDSVGFIEWRRDSNTFFYFIFDDKSGTKHLYLYNASTGQSTDLNLIYYSSIHSKISPSSRYIAYIKEVERLDSGQVGLNTTYHYWLYDVESGSNQYIGDFGYHGQLHWLYHNDQEYLITQDLLTSSQSNPFLTYLVDPVTMSRCKIGVTDYYLEFQPQG